MKRLIKRDTIENALKEVHERVFQMDEIAKKIHMEYNKVDPDYNYLKSLSKSLNETAKINLMTFVDKDTLPIQ
ncbi:MAG: hypothetical protein H7329_10680 [Opitutaceae bacterium]|nr:hypothetical protein [Cytophagales bacterium]